MSVQDSDESTRPGRPRAKATHDAIVTAAETILAEDGYSGFSIEAVAARAGVGKTSIYRRWSSKGALLLDLYVEGMTSDRALSAATPIRDQFVDLLHQSLDRLRRSSWSTIIRSLVAEAQGDPEVAEMLRNRVVEPRRKTGRQLMEIGVKRGEIRSDADFDITLDAVFGALWYRLLVGHAPIDKAFVRKIVGQAFEGIQTND